MSKKHDMGWKLEFVISFIILVLTALWIVFFQAGKANADYTGPHPEAEAEQVVKRKGMALWRFLDGPVRCYWLITDVRMLGVQTTLSCVVPEQEKQDESEPTEGRRVPPRIQD